MAPLSNAERKWKYQAKWSDKEKDEIKEKDKLWKQKIRASTVLTEEQKEANCVKECKRKRSCRETKKRLKLNNAIFSFLRTSIWRVRPWKKKTKHYQKLLLKKIEVIITLVNSLSPVSKAIVKEPTRVPYKHVLSEETKDLVC